MKPALAVVAVVAVAALLPGVAAAHPRLTATTPRAGAVLAHAPRKVVVRLTESATPVGEGIEVTGPDGLDVTRGPVIVSGPTLTRFIDAHQRGSYVVEWLVVGDDTHPARGSFLFSVGEPTRTTLPGHAAGGVAIVAAGRWLSLLGFALGFGIVFAALLSGGMTERCWQLVSAGIVLMIVAEPVALLGEMATLAPARLLDPSFAEDVLLTNYGQFAALRLGAAIGLWALAGAVRHSEPRIQWLIPVAGIAVAFVYAGSAHRIASLPSPFTVQLAALHVAGFGAWVGCVIVARLKGRGRPLSKPATLAALTLVMTGSALALAHIPAPSTLVETAYGATLGVKLALVAVAFALGAAARRRAELAVALVVLAAASVLVSLVPPT
jgi:methionine-rich copper-binding protein CopC/putative copper export protein